jgi:hypothetical protein
LSRLLAAVLLLVAAVAVLASRAGTFALVGFRPLQTLDARAIEAPFQADGREVSRFLEQRNRVELTVPRAMTVGELVRLYQLDFAHVRTQIARQIGSDPAKLTDATPLRQGQRLSLTLTPPQESLP